MKKFLLIVLAAILLPSACLAGSIQGSATVRLMSDLKNPVEGTLGLEQSGVRLSGSLGSDNRQSYALDFLARSKDGMYVGAGVVGDRIEQDSYVESDTTVTKTGHGHGHHKKHHKEQTTTTITNTVTLGSIDLDLHPAILMGMSAKRGLFVESRVIFSNGYDIENRTSVGVRF
jgi:hypothetical protein